MDWFSHMGVPVRLTTDGGPQFRDKFKAFCKEWSINYDGSSAFHHEANGYAEAAVKAMRALVTKVTKDGNLNRAEFFRGLLEFRNAPRKDGLSPAQRLFGRPMRTRLPAYKMVYQPVIRRELRKADTRATILREQAKSRYNAGSRPLDCLKPGDIVRIQHANTKKWDMIAKVVSVHSRGRSYIVRSETGRLYRGTASSSAHMCPAVTGLSILMSQWHPLSYEEAIVRGRPRST
jgi:hypothetical protein